MSTDNSARIDSVAQYYRYHSPVYDITRWSFLFGRQKLLHSLPDLPNRPQILEVGCGTGSNLKTLERLYPDALIHGVDLSEDMLAIATRKLENLDRIILTNTRYGSGNFGPGTFDLVLLSYSLTMLGDHFDNAFQQISKDLKPGGCIAVVDFNDSPFRWFRKWMKRNYVKINGELLPRLKQKYQPVYQKVDNAYFGLWSYFLFIGRKNH